MSRKGGVGKTTVTVGPRRDVRHPARGPRRRRREPRCRQPGSSHRRRLPPHHHRPAIQRRGHRHVLAAMRHYTSQSRVTARGPGVRRRREHQPGPRPAGLPPGCRSTTTTTSSCSTRDRHPRQGQPGPHRRGRPARPCPAPALDGAGRSPDARSARAPRLRRSRLVGCRRQQRRLLDEDPTVSAVNHHFTQRCAHVTQVPRTGAGDRRAHPIVADVPADTGGLPRRRRSRGRPILIDMGARHEVLTSGGAAACDAAPSAASSRPARGRRGGRMPAGSWPRVPTPARRDAEGLRDARRGTRSSGVGRHHLRHGLGDLRRVSRRLLRPARSPQLDGGA